MLAPLGWGGGECGGLVVDGSEGVRGNEDGEGRVLGGGEAAGPLNKVKVWVNLWVRPEGWLRLGVPNLQDLMPDDLRWS